MATSGSNYIGGRVGTSLTANNVDQLTAALLNMNANKKGCINTDKIINSGSVQLTGIQSVTGATATLTNTTSIVVVSNDPEEAITLTAATGGEVLGRIVIIRNLNTTYAVALGAASCAKSKSTICYYTGSAWENLITLAYA